MVSDSGVREAVDAAKKTLKKHGIECGTTADEFQLWFQADTPFDEGGEFDAVMRSPLLIIHELVEIDEVKRMGLALTKDVIVKNIEKIDNAHLKASRIELQIAASRKDLGHLLSRAKDVEMWSEDATVTETNKRSYVDLHRWTMDTISAIRRTRRKWPVVVGVSAAVAAFDYTMLSWAVPYADEHYTNEYGSVGYALAMLTAFVTFMAAIGLMTYYFQHDSYASDKWR